MASIINIYITKHGPLNVKFATGITVFGFNDTWTTLNIQFFDEQRGVFGCVFYDVPKDRGAVISVSSLGH